ncbi:MAG: hypothetical protein JWM56_856 [Candidatus Peribacteria bacterium]|nr:hypothetical protein [Candidatus Peribacteria bacterium]
MKILLSFLISLSLLSPSFASATSYKKVQENKIKAQAAKEAVAKVQPKFVKIAKKDVSQRQADAIRGYVDSVRKQAMQECMDAGTPLTDLKTCYKQHSDILVQQKVDAARSGIQQ